MIGMLLRRVRCAPASLRAALFYEVGIGWTKGIGLLIIPLLTAVLPPAAFGKLDLLSSAAEIGSLIAGVGLVDTLYRFGSASGPEGRQAAAEILGLGLAVAIGILSIMLVLAPSIAALIPLPTTATEIRLLGAAVATEALIGVPLAWLRMQGRAGHFLLATMLRISVQAVLVVVLVMNGFGVAGVLAGGAVTALLTAGALGVVQARKTGLQIDPRRWGRLLRYGGALVGAGLASFALGTADRWLLATSVPAMELGRYAVACKVAGVAAALTQPLEMWWYPQRFRVLAAADGAAATVSIVDRLACLYILAAGFVAIAAPTGLLWLTPPAYHGAVAFVPWLVLGLWLQQVAGLYSIGCYLGSSGVRPMAANVAAAVVAVALYLLLIPRLGVMGAVVATVLAQFVRTVLFHVMSQRVRRLRHRLPALAAVAAISAAAVFPPTFAPGMTSIAAGLACLATAACLGAGLGLLPLPRGVPRGLLKPLRIGKAVADA